MLYYKEVGKDHGVYIYDAETDVWKPTNISILNSDGVYIIYFNNELCPACRIYDQTWFQYVKENAKKLTNHYFITALSGWFTRRCKSPEAQEAFTRFNIHSTPTTLLIAIKNQKEVYRESYEGAIKMETLKKIIEEFKQRAEMHEKGEKPERPTSEEASKCKSKPTKIKPHQLLSSLI